MPGGPDAKIFTAVWASEATRAANDPDAAQARAHEAEDRDAAAQRTVHPAHLARRLIRGLRRMGGNV